MVGFFYRKFMDLPPMNPRLRKGRVSEIVSSEAFKSIGEYFSLIIHTKRIMSLNIS